MDSGGLKNNQQQGPHGQPTANFAPNNFSGVADLDRVNKDGANIVESMDASNAVQTAGAEVLRNYEQQTGPSLGGQMTTTTTTPQPAVAQRAVVVGGTTDNKSVVTAAPAVASDTDKIEQEWIDAAKTVVSKTKDDPFLQAQAVAALKRDYVKKRYGKEVGKAPDDAI